MILHRITGNHLRSFHFCIPGLVYEKKKEAQHECKQQLGLQSRTLHPRQAQLLLRDVDGFLLKEDAFPDRALMPRLPGLVHMSKRYPMSVFSDAEWQSEERDRYLRELDRKSTRLNSSHQI